VVKVQRTGLLELFKNDLQNLKFAAKVFDKIDPKSDGADRDWVSIYEESAKLLYRYFLLEFLEFLKGLLVFFPDGNEPMACNV